MNTDSPRSRAAIRFVLIFCPLIGGLLMRSVLLFLFPFLSPPPAPSTVHGGGTTYSAESARVRGGSYLSIIPDARVAARMRRDPDNISDDLGFRVLRILP